MNRFIDIPGLEVISRSLTMVLIVSGQMALFVVLLLCVRHYVKPTSNGKRALGILFGTVFGIIAASAYASTYERMFYAEPEKVSVLLLLAVLTNIAISDFIFSMPKE